MQVKAGESANATSRRPQCIVEAPRLGGGGGNAPRGELPLRPGGATCAAASGPKAGAPGAAGSHGSRWGAQRGSELAGLPPERAARAPAPTRKAVAPRTGSRWQRSHTLKGATHTARRRAAGKAPTAAVPPGGAPAPEFTPGVAARRLATEEGRALAAPKSQRALRSPARGSPPPPSRPGRAAHLCAETRRCSRRRTSARRAGRAAG